MTAAIISSLYASKVWKGLGETNDYDVRIPRQENAIIALYALIRWMDIIITLMKTPHNH